MISYQSLLLSTIVLNDTWTSVLVSIIFSVVEGEDSYVVLGIFLLMKNIHA